MGSSSYEKAKPSKRSAQQRIIAPISPQLRRASVLSLLAGLIWPAQAALVAWAISGWVMGEMDRTLWAAGLFVFGGLIRAMLDRRAGAYLFGAADQTIQRERELLITREARARASTSSAEIAALLVQKLPLLQPWVTRYYVAMTRVSVLPLVLLGLTFYVSWAAGLVLLVAGPLIPVFMALVGMAAEDASRKQMNEISTMNSMLMERLSAMLDIRLLGATERAADSFAERAEALRTRTMAVLRVAFLSSTVLELFSALGVAMLAVFIGFSLLGEITFGSWSVPLTLGEGLFVLLIAPEFFQPFRDLAAAWHDRADGLAVVAELEELDSAERVRFVGSAEMVAPLPGELSVSLHGAVAALPGRQVALPDFILRAGQSLAITGPSGAGKTTALAAIAGLVPVAHGQVFVCGGALDDTSADAWRRRISLIPQTPHFSDHTLREWLDPEGHGADPWPALTLAEARSLVERLPDGLDSRLGQSGGGVSGGEARRLMIARAVLSGRELILADEPTADLDPVTAAQVIRALRRLTDDGHSLLVATHDPALVEAMEFVVEIAPVSPEQEEAL
ncbi:ABC transporter ATP-binding protein/permease [Halomonas halocynthiae]|uniref:ABC transporter ATP-binding protein/permease n=1 Tax=Halomonas halocynthiae TaxID=176290 RepID=UPI0003FCA47E|nr:ATP-binding cassette domain-containing protein [Halomonas halocynthiae]